MFFAYEDRKYIVHLIVESYYRLPSGLTLSDDPETAKKLWEKTTAFMAYSVSKNPKVEKMVVEALQSNHKPYLLLCKSHVVEVFDRSKLDVPAKV